MRFKKTSYICVIILAIWIASFPRQAGAEVTVSAHHAVLMEQVSGRVLFEKNAHEQRKIASITKIMTAILAIESGKMDNQVTISDKAIGTEGSTLYLKNGQKMKLRDLVYGLMLRSGNDAAVAIAEYVGGSMEGFVWLMNQKAQEIGMENTHFSNPHGLDNTENHYSTAYDMALLTRYAMNNEEYRKISSTKVHRASNPFEKWDYSWKNKNKMLSLYKYSTGGKTGYTKLAKRTLVSTAQKGDMSLIAVTLNAPDDWDDHITMFETAFHNYDLVEILDDDVVKKVKDSFYKNKAVLKNEFYYPLTSEEKKEIKVDYVLIQPQSKWKKGKNLPEKVGKAYIFLNGEPIGTRNIFFEPVSETFGRHFFESWRTLFFMIIGMNADG